MSKNWRRIWLLLLFALFAFIWLTKPYWPPSAEERALAIRVVTFNGRYDLVPGIEPAHVQISGFQDHDYWFEYRVPPGSVLLYEARLKTLFATGNLWRTNDAVLKSAADPESHGAMPRWFPRGKPPGMDVLYFERLDDAPGRPRATPNGPPYTRACRWYYFSPKDDRIFLFAW